MKMLTKTNKPVPPLLAKLIDLIDKNRDQKIKTGWVYFGSLTEDDAYKWSERYFDSLTGKKMPEVGDQIQSNAKINLRAGFIEYLDKKWVNKPMVGLIAPKERYYITAVKEVTDGFWWAQIRQAP
jgi:hypothetical protein